MATGMQVWSTTASSNANADTNINWAEGMAPSQVDDSARAMMASAAKWVSDNCGTLVTSGSSSAFTVATNQVEGALTDGYTVSVMLHTTPDSGATLAVDGLTAKPINLNTGNAIAGNQVLGNTLQRLTYSATYGAWLLNSYNPMVPVGAISPYAGSSSPGGWLLCDGTGYSQSTYAALFAIVSTTYGTTGSGMFSVPDLTGRVVAGKEASATRLTTAVSGINGGTLGASGGAQGETIAQGNLPNVNFTNSGITAGVGSLALSLPVNTVNVFSAGTGAVPITANASSFQSFPSFGGSGGSAWTGSPSITAQGSAASGGSGTQLPTVQPTLVLNYIIFAGI